MTSAANAPAALQVFAYEAQTADGRLFRGTLEAASADEVTGRLAALQLRVMTVTPAEKDVARGRPLNAHDFELFNQQLAHLTEAGLPVEHGLRLIAMDLRAGRLADAAKDVALDLERGVPLEAAFSKHATRFPPLYGRLVEAGAKAGNLPGMLFNLGRHLQLVSRLRQSLWRTLAYPIMVLLVLSVVLLFVSLYVLPQFQAMFDSMENDFRSSMERPWPTQIVMALGTAYPFLLLGVVVFVMAIVLGDVTAQMSGARGVPWLSILRRVPLIGGVIKASLLASWIDALRIGIEAGLDLPRAVSLATEATSPRGALARDSAALVKLLGEGAPLANFRGALIPATVPAAIELAAVTHDLPGTLRTLARMYEQQAEQRLRILPMILTPIMMIVIGGGIAFCISALFLPFGRMLRLIQSVSGGGDF